MRVSNLGAVLSCAVLLSVMGQGASNAASTTINTFDNGWYQTNGFTAGVNNIYVGANPNTGAVYNNWLAFNLSSLAGQNITSATLTFFAGNGNYRSSSSTETLGLFDYTGSINALIGNQTSAAIGTDLGTGVSYGTAVVSGTPTNFPSDGVALGAFSVTLTAAAINALNAAANNSLDQRFVIGGALLSFTSNWDRDSLFVSVGSHRPLDSAASLTLEVSPVPLPAALPLFASILAGSGLIAWRRKRKPATLAA